MDELELQLKQRNLREVRSSEIGEMVLSQLREISEVAYVRFACVYRRFKDKDEIMHAIGDSL